jgi:hypothetical protein
MFHLDTLPATCSTRAGRTATAAPPAGATSGVDPQKINSLKPAMQISQKNKLSA